MTPLPIIDFHPLVKELVWGGRKLESVLGKPLPTPSRFGESWEVVDLPEDQSLVRGGVLEGTSLAELRVKEREALLGGAPLLDGRFPLLFKFIDASKTLSVQVHPNEEACVRLGQDARPKTEAWYIIDSEPGAVLYVGMKEAVTPKQFKDSLDRGTVETLLHTVEVKPGDFVYLPAGTIHAIGAGILLAEVQQSSNTTYRVFDWNRMGLDGKPRRLHVDQALASMNFNQIGPPPGAPPPSGRPGIACDYFIMETLKVTDAVPQDLQGEGLLVLMGVDGGGIAHVLAGEEHATLTRGETRLIPARLARTVQISAEEELTILATRIP